jgi:hypothetical protein
MFSQFKPSVLNSCIGDTTQIRQYSTGKELPSLTTELKEIIYGLLLGDLYIDKQPCCRKARIQFLSGGKKFQYAMHLYSIFAPYCGTSPRVSTVHLKRSGKSYETVRFKTLSSFQFNEFRSLFYPNGIKIVPASIGELLTARSLAL